MGKLYLVPTPIGNLKDITLRAIDVLAQVDFILAEDTRRTKKLLKHYDINTITKSYHIYNEHKVLDEIINLLISDNNIALVVDEYGEIEGLISVEDIFIEIVGKFGSDIIEQEKEFSLQPDGSVVTDGNSKIRDLNGFMNWSINDENAKTINGLILETIDEIPIANSCFPNESYRFEILKIKNNSITSVKIQKI